MGNLSEIVQSYIACIKCNSEDLYLVELWQGHSITWEQIDGKFDRHDGSLEPGDPFRIEAKCKKCGHIWKVRKATHIGDCYKH